MFTADDVDLFAQAAGAGDILRLKMLLKAGVPVDAVGKSRVTALCHAATCGQAIAAQVLLAAGAAADGPAEVPPLPEPADEVEAIMRKVAREAGAKLDLLPSTPLIFAATFGYRDVVQLLLGAGADPNLRRGVRQQSALEHARYNRHKAVVEMLLAAGALPGTGEFAFKACKAFAGAAGEPAFQERVTWLAALCNHRPRPWKKRKGAFHFTLKNFGVLEALYPEARTPPPGDPRGAEVARREQLVHLLEDDVRAGGHSLVLADSVGYQSPAGLRLFPTAEKFAVIAASGTNGGNRGYSTGDVIAWLLELDKDNPFVLTLCSYNAVAGRFLQPFKDAPKWAAKMQRFCPDLDEDEAAVARDLEESLRFDFGWF